MSYDIKKQVARDDYFSQQIFNYNARAKLEKQNIIDFLSYAESIKDILQAQNGKRVDKRFLQKIENKDFHFYLENDYKTLAGDLILFFVNRCTKGKSYAFGGAEKTENNNYLNSGQYKKYFQLAKNESSNAIFDYDLFLQGLKKLQGQVDYINKTLKNQKQQLKKAIKLNNALYDLFYENDFIRHILSNN